MNSQALKSRKCSSVFAQNKLMEISNIEAILINNAHQCKFQCHSIQPPLYK